MKIIELPGQLDEINEIFQQYFDQVRNAADFSYHPFFRGLSKSTYKLYSKLARPFTDSVENPIEREKFKSIEQDVIKRFNEKLSNERKENILTVPHRGNDVSRSWYLVVQMQHLEMPTRMMDWTQKPLIALFFAVGNEKHDDTEGVVWGFPISQGNFHLIKPEQELDPFDETQPLLVNVQGNLFLYDNYVEKLAEKRILKQGGRFFFQNADDSLIAIEENPKFKDTLTKFVIPPKAKKNIREILDVELRKSLRTFLSDQEWEALSKKTFLEIVMDRFDPAIERISKEIDQEFFSACY